MAKPGLRRALLALALLAAGIAAVYLLNAYDGRGEPRSGTEAVDSPSAGRRTGPRRSAPRQSGDAPDGGVAGPVGGERLDAPLDLGDFDFESIRVRTPDNLYWMMAVPTDDPALLAVRREERTKRDAQFGRVQSNTATIEEIRSYYSFRRQLSEDYIEVMDLMLAAHGDELSERDAGLFELAVAMHSSRLREIPGKVDDAIRRKAAYDEAKAAWQAQQATEPTGDPDDQD